MRRRAALILMVLVAGLLAVPPGANADSYPPGEGVIEGRVTIWGDRRAGREERQSGEARHSRRGLRLVSM